MSVKKNAAKTAPADNDSISDLEKTLGFSLSKEYKDYLSKYGVISFASHETYGLGVPESSHVNVLNAFNDLSKDSAYPKEHIPLMEIGDGHYYLYDNANQQVVIWATPNGGSVKHVPGNLETFLDKYIFQK